MLNENVFYALLYIQQRVITVALFETTASAPDSAQAIAWPRGCFNNIVRALHTRAQGIRREDGA